MHRATMARVSEKTLVAAAALLRWARSVAVLTGAGVSAESGVPTFRGADGLWEGRPAQQVATPEAFAADPRMVWRFYEWRRGVLARVAPNPGHAVLAAWRSRFAGYTLITQNVDGLHQRAGAADVLELHGNIWKIRCSACGREREDRTVPLPELPPRCSACGGLERPGVVWFGEALPEQIFARAAEAAQRADVFLVVGTSAVVYPAAGLAEAASLSGGRVIEINPEPSALAAVATVELRGPAGELLPRLDALLEGGR